MFTKQIKIKLQWNENKWTRKIHGNEWSNETKTQYMTLFCGDDQIPPDKMPPSAPSAPSLTLTPTPAPSATSDKGRLLKSLHVTFWWF